MREVRTPGAFPDRPDGRRRRLQPLVHAHVPASVQLDTGLLETDPGGVRRAAHRDDEVAALDPLLSHAGAHNDRHILSGSAQHTEGLRAHERLDPFVTENALHLLRNVAILLTEKLGPSLDDRHAAAEATVRLADFETDIAARRG